MSGTSGEISLVVLDDELTKFSLCQGIRFGVGHFISWAVMYSRELTEYNLAPGEKGAEEHYDLSDAIGRCQKLSFASYL